MKILKKALLYDISNIAYMIADTGENDRHVLHKVRDICQDGNIDRVSRILGLAYSDILTVLAPLLLPCRINVETDFSAAPHNYPFIFRDFGRRNCIFGNERKLRIKELAHEYMVAKVLADWLGMTLPEAADVWEVKVRDTKLELKGLVERVTAEIAGKERGVAFGRRILF